MRLFKSQPLTLRPGASAAAVPDFAKRPAGWEAKLDLSFRRLGDRSVLAARRHEGPLLVQKPLYPEGQAVCHVLLVHPPGGIAAGDRLALDADVQPGARVLLTTPAATKWYKSDGRRAGQQARFTVGDDAILEWLPQETIVFDRADVETQAAVLLTASAVYAGWEIVSLGRHAAGERFTRGRLRQRLRIHREDRLLWNESLALAGSDPILDASIGFRGQPVFGSMIVAAGSVPRALTEACRELAPREGEGGVTALPAIFSARYLGRSAEAALDYFECIRAVLRPWYAGRPAVRARIWDT